MRRPWPTRIRAGSASDRTRKYPRPDKRQRQTNPSRRELSVLSFQSSEVRTASPGGKRTHRSPGNPRQPAKTADQITKRTQSCTSHSASGGSVLSRQLSVIRPPCGCRGASKPGAPATGPSIARAPTCARAKRTQTRSEPSAISLLLRTPAAMQAPAPNEPKLVDSHQLSVIRPVPSTPLGSPAFPTRQRGKYPCETNPKLRECSVISSQLPVASDLPPIPPGPSTRHQPAVGPRRVPTGATTGAKRTQAPRQPESPHSWPPPSCLSASVPSCLPSFQTNLTPRKLGKGGRDDVSEL